MHRGELFELCAGVLGLVERGEVLELRVRVLEPTGWGDPGDRVAGVVGGGERGVGGRWRAVGRVGGGQVGG